MFRGKPKVTGKFKVSCIWGISLVWFGKRLREILGSVCFQIVGESFSDDKNSAQKFKETFLQHLEEGYSRDDVYSADDGGVNWKALPRKSLTSKQKSTAPSFKVSNVTHQRVTAMSLKHAWNELWPDLEGKNDFGDDHRKEITDFVQLIAGFQEYDEDGETWMAYIAETCGFQMLNYDEIVTFVQEKPNPVDD
ncbi:hypothetical protein TNCV_2798051 [Trichonephila clavipes]|nr:hypothetical protein TNCV_2798051 [Trichonephila clavipes]